MPEAKCLVLREGCEVDGKEAGVVVAVAVAGQQGRRHVVHVVDLYGVCVCVCVCVCGVYMWVSVGVGVMLCTSWICMGCVRGCRCVGVMDRVLIYDWVGSASQSVSQSVNQSIDA